MDNEEYPDNGPTDPWETSGPGVAPWFNGKGPTVPGVDSQVIRAASEMTAEQKAAPEWLWHEDHRNVTSYGRWLCDPSQAPYIRADIVLALLEAARAR